jgi:hypothetical protein
MRNLVNGSIFGNYHNITQLGVQGLPGTKFYLNNPSNKNNPIIIGSTGIYELDLQGLSEIVSIQFDRASIQAINDNRNAYLIVDIIYEGGDN